MVERTQPANPMEECAFCHTLASQDQPLHFCSGCRQRQYCNQACQRAAWRAGHKDECARLRATSSSSASSASSAAAAVPSSSAAAASSVNFRSGGDGGGGGGTTPPDPATGGTTAATSSESLPSRKKKNNKKKKKNSKMPETNSNNGPAAGAEPNTASHGFPQTTAPTNSKKKNTGDTKTMWVTIFKCFHCGKRGHDLIKCHQCEEAYYCGRKCEAAHSEAHAKVCIATVTAKAQRAHRERIARAVREEGKDNVGGGEEDEVCVICQSKPVAPVQVNVCERTHARVDVYVYVCAY